MVADKLLLNISFFMGVFGDNKWNMINKLGFIGEMQNTKRKVQNEGTALRL